jgi:ADP-heptose:LPS heptosyltransferase
LSPKRFLSRLRDRCFGTELDRVLRRAVNTGGRRVLVYWNRGLGDIALGLCALLARLRERLPGCHIAVLTRPDLEQAFALTDVDRILVCPSLRRGDAQGFGMACRALELDPGTFDVVLERPDPTAWLADSPGHFVPRLRWRNEWNSLADRFAGISLDRPVIAVHVSSETGQFYGYVKDWPPHFWRELFQRVGARHSVQWILLGHAQAERFDQSNALDLRGRTSLLEVLAIVRNRARILVAVDAGILAMAYYLDETFPLEVISLWSDPRQGVLKQRVESPNSGLRHCPLVGDGEDVRRLGVERVEAAVVAALARLAPRPVPQ